MSLRVRIVCAVVLSGLVGLATVVLPATAGAESCPNEQIRAEQGATRLPDCRAFEMVTPEIKSDDNQIESAYGFPDGNHVFYASFLPLPGAQNGNNTRLLGTRTPNGWKTTPLTFPAPGGNSGGFLGGLGELPAVAFASGYTEALFTAPFKEAPLDETSTEFGNVYRLNLESGDVSLAALPDSGPLTSSMDQYGTFIAGVSENGAHVLFQTAGRLPTAPGTPEDTEPESVSAEELYDRTGGHTYLVSVLPDGSIPPNGVLGQNASPEYPGLSYGAVSPDGSNVVFEVKGACGNECVARVYLRENDSRTIELAGGAHGGAFAGRSADGSKVFTGGIVTTTGVAGQYQLGGLYEYDVASGTTTTITADGQLVASSADGSRVYYLVEEESVYGSGMKNANPGLYLWEGGRSKPIPNAGGFASSAVNNSGWSPFTYQNNLAVATPDGASLLFLDTAKLTSYNNFGPRCKNEREDPEPGNCAEAYVYNASTGAVTCVSCNPTGAPPLGNASLLAFGGESNYFSDPNVDPLQPPSSSGEISPDGSRVFFETTDALVPQDTNGLPDVYEWENGRIYLISSGEGINGSQFSGASGTGDDVFITTVDRLAPQDDENSTEIYDARVDGGFPYRPFSPGCDSGQCQGPQTPAPNFGPPASATFVGLGNPVAPVTAQAVRAKAKAKFKGRSKHKKRTKTRNKTKRAGGVIGKRKERK